MNSNSGAGILTERETWVGARGEGLRVWFRWPPGAHSIVNMRGFPARASVVFDEQEKVLAIELAGLPEKAMTVLARSETHGADVDRAGSALRVRVAGGTAGARVEGDSTVAFRLCDRELVGIDVRFGAQGAGA
ncbi:hypothetical protein [Actinomadura terrae]|uniref:hypothetical protein n=1 Tax=Actinomadura terrae TaxID=604353 RepID=UPI001FA6C6C3|nr:hypothetical protein [Actinomadura terrae]